MSQPISSSVQQPLPGQFVSPSPKPPKKTSTETRREGLFIRSPGAQVSCHPAGSPQGEWKVQRIPNKYQKHIRETIDRAREQCLEKQGLGYSAQERAPAPRRHCAEAKPMHSLSLMQKEQQSPQITSAFFGLKGRSLAGRVSLGSEHASIASPAKKPKLVTFEVPAPCGSPKSRRTPKRRCAKWSRFPPTPHRASGNGRRRSSLGITSPRSQPPTPLRPSSKAGQEASLTSPRAPAPSTPATPFSCWSEDSSERGWWITQADPTYSRTPSLFGSPQSKRNSLSSNGSAPTPTASLPSSQRRSSLGGSPVGFPLDQAHSRSFVAHEVESGSQDIPELLSGRFESPKSNAAQQEEGSIGPIPEMDSAAFLELLTQGAFVNDIVNPDQRSPVLASSGEFQFPGSSQAGSPTQILSESQAQALPE